MGNKVRKKNKKTCDLSRQKQSAGGVNVVLQAASTVIVDFFMSNVKKS